MAGCIVGVCAASVSLSRGSEDEVGGGNNTAFLTPCSWRLCPSVGLTASDPSARLVSGPIPGSVVANGV